MEGDLRTKGLALLAALFCVAATAAGAAAFARAAGNVPRDPQVAVGSQRLDVSGRKRVGTASFYAKRFAGRKMADGTPMHPHGDNAASKTLPLGTTATVTNLETGKSAVVTIRDRGPYVAGRIVDLSPATSSRSAAVASNWARPWRKIPAIPGNGAIESVQSLSHLQADLKWHCRSKTTH